MVPAPTVRPPSRMANRRPFSIAIGVIRFDLQVHVVARHHHLHTLRQLRRPRHVRRPEEELRPIPVEKRRVPPALLLGQDVRLRLELHVRRDRPRLGAHLPALHVLALRASQKQSHVVSRLPLIQELAEHLHSRHDLLLCRPDPDDLHLFSDLHHPALDSARHHRPAARDREHVLDRHQKVLIHRTLRHRYVRVHRVHQLQNALGVRRSRVRRLPRLQRRSLHDRNLLPRKPVRRQQLPDLQLHKLQELRVVHHVRLVQKHHDERHAHLPRQQYVLPRLRHRPVRRRHHQNRPVHLRRPRDHVLHVVRVPRTVHVRVVPLVRRVLHVRRVDRDPSRLLFRRVVDLVVRLGRRKTLLRQSMSSARARVTRAEPGWSRVTVIAAGVQVIVPARPRMMVWRVMARYSSSSRR